MRSILNEMQTDPKKAQAAMNDPTISAKLQKLIAAGVLQVAHVALSAHVALNAQRRARLRFDLASLSLPSTYRVRP